MTLGHLTREYTDCSLDYFDTRFWKYNKILTVGYPGQFQNTKSFLVLKPLVFFQNSSVFISKTRMPNFTIIYRLYKPLILVESMEYDDSSFDHSHRKQAKSLLDQISKGAEKTGILTSGDHYFLYFIENGICYMTLCDNSYPKKLAYSFLEEIKKEFEYAYGKSVADAKRPYAFETFGMLTKLIL